MFLFVKRYLLSKKSHSVVNVITLLSLVSISLPVAAVIVLMSVFNGFGELIDSTNRVIDPDLSVVPSQGSLFEIESLDMDAIAAVEGVEAFSLLLEQSILAQSDDNQAVVTLRGVDSAFLSVTPLDRGIVKGEFHIELGELDRIVLGRSMGYRLGVRNVVDSFVDLYALKQSGFSSLLPMSNYQRQKIKVSALYTADVQSEDRYAFTSLRAVQKLTGSPGKASQLSVALTPGANEQQVQQQIAGVVGEEFEVRSRYDLNPMLYDIVKYEKWGLFFVSILIMLLASFTLIGALTMLIIEKRDNIYSLRAMGASWAFVKRIFFGEGVLISSVGVALGAVVGCGVTLLQQSYGLVKLPSQTFLSEQYPVDLQLVDVALVVVFALGVATTLSYIVVRQMIKNQ